MPQDKPTVSLNLNKLEREGAPDPFSALLGTKRYVFADPLQMDYREMSDALVSYANGRGTRALLNLIVNEKDREAFFGNRLPVFKLNALLGAYLSHYGLDPGEVPASSPS